ncbi:hypothetical protein AYI69_g133 [Smittium culicis]|uniref:Uncharacterized protein n=1 Tax=Smittium culicis TaxID=133412 RepID=A0A1R1YTV9_9FUNG|nr:hypothetical protein AYI69_g133 [Smittium culicis]
MPSIPPYPPLIRKLGFTSIAILVRFYCTFMFLIIELIFTHSPFYFRFYLVDIKETIADMSCQFSSAFSYYLLNRPNNFVLIVFLSKWSH